MQTYDFSPFYRSTVGFDRLFTRLDGMVGKETKSYPPYNIERLSDDSWRVSVAVAGFSTNEISIEVKENNLHISGARAQPTPDKNREYLHRGIAERSFELHYQLGDYVEVASAGLEHGLLNIDLKREVPESKRPKQIKIQSSPVTEQVEQVTDKTKQSKPAVN